MAANNCFKRAKAGAALMTDASIRVRRSLGPIGSAAVGAVISSGKHLSAGCPQYEGNRSPGMGLASVGGRLARGCGALTDAQHIRDDKVGLDDASVDLICGHIGVHALTG